MKQAEKKTVVFEFVGLGNQNRMVVDRVQTVNSDHIKTPVSDAPPDLTDLVQEHTVIPSVIEEVEIVEVPTKIEATENLKICL